MTSNNTYYIVTNEAESYQYHEIRTDNEIILPTDKYVDGLNTFKGVYNDTVSRYYHTYLEGFDVYDLQHIFAHTTGPVYLREATLPENDSKYKSIWCGYRTNMVVLGERYRLDDVATYKMLEEKGAAIEPFYQKLLKYHSESGNLKILEYLMFNHSFVKPDIAGLHALRFSAASGRLDAVQYLTQPNLFEKKLDINIGSCILVDAAKNGNIDVVKHLIENGAKPSCGYAFLCAIIHGHSDVAEYLAEFLDGNVGDLAETKRMAIELAVYWNRCSIVEFLIRLGVDIHAGEEELLRIACSKGHFEMVKCLVKNGADIHINNDEPLMRTVVKFHLSVVIYLLGQGANIKILTDESLKYHKLCQHKELEDYLIEKGANITKQIDDGLAPGYTKINPDGSTSCVLVMYDDPLERRYHQLSMWFVMKFG